MGIIRLRVELRALRQSINELCNTIKKHSETAHPAQEACNKNDAIPKSVPVTVSYDEQVNKDQKKYYGTQEGIEKWTRRAVIAAVIYAAIAAWQLCEMREQVKLTRQVLEETEAARIVVDTSNGPSLNSNPNGIWDLVFWFKNDGHMTAQRANVQLQIARKSTPNGDDIGDVIDWSIEIGPFPPTSPKMNGKGIMKSRQITISPQELDRIYDSKETIRVKGTIFFNNGFEDKPIEQPVCYSYLSEVIRAKNENSSGGRFVECDEFDRLIPSLLKKKEEAAKKN